MFCWATFFSLSSSESWMTFWGCGYDQVTSIPCGIPLTSHKESKGNTALENTFKVEASMAPWAGLEKLGVTWAYRNFLGVILWLENLRVLSVCFEKEMLKYNNVKKMTCEKFQIMCFVPSGSAAATAAKSLQSCPTLRPNRWKPTRLPCPWDSPGKNTGVGCHFLLQYSQVHGLKRNLSTFNIFDKLHTLCIKFLSGWIT